MFFVITFTFKLFIGPVRSKLRGAISEAMISLRLLTASKSVRIKCSSVSHFPLFGLNTQIHFVNLLIPSDCGKMLTRKTPNTDEIQMQIQIFHAFFLSKCY